MFPDTLSDDRLAQIVNEAVKEKYFLDLIPVTYPS